MTLIFADRAIVGTWLEVTVRATPQTGLAAADRFYVGNSIGESGNAGDTLVNASDFLLTRSNEHTSLAPAAITDPVDFNRDRLVNVADLLLVRGQRPEAKTHLDRALALAPDDPLVHLVFARWLLRGGTPAEQAQARPHLERALRMPSPPLEAYLLMGQLAREQKRWDEALRFLRRAAGIAPRDPRVFFQLSQAYRGAGRELEGERAYQTYVRLGRGRKSP